MNTNEMLDFAKSVADADRLRIIGLLAQKPGRLSEITAALGFYPADTSHHLEQLLQSGIVRLADGVYALDDQALEKLARAQLERARPTYTPEPDLEKDRQKVLAAHLNPDGSLKTIPLQHGKRQIILDYLILAFSAGTNYTEKEVNLLLSRFHPDTAALRRYLVDAGMLERERNGSRYWKPE